MRHLVWSFGLLIMLSFSVQLQAEIYKYRDDSGRWQFSDKPLHADAEKLKLTRKVVDEKLNKPSLQFQSNDEETAVSVINPYFAPIQVFFRIEGRATQVSKLVSANETSLIGTYNEPLSEDNTMLSWLIGDPDTKPTDFNYLVPFGGHKPQRVSQSFKGRFSHSREPNRYAVDIALIVGTPITAAREGIVISTKDDYSTAGVSSPFFFDKANMIRVLHDDGTFAIYAHLLLGSIKTKPGDRVSAGQVIALSGNTGYSTGPHLHFVIQYNDKGRPRSLPFKFMQKTKMVEPEAGMWLLPSG